MAIYANDKWPLMAMRMATYGNSLMAIAMATNANDKWPEWP